MALCVEGVRALPPAHLGGSSRAPVGNLIFDIVPYALPNFSRVNADTGNVFV